MVMCMVCLITSMISLMIMIADVECGTTDTNSKRSQKPKVASFNRCCLLHPHPHLENLVVLNVLNICLIVVCFSKNAHFPMPSVFSDVS